MSIKTDKYLLDAFLDGDIYSASGDNRRFNTIDNQLGSIGEIVGDGRIDGWVLQEITYPEIKMSAGSGIIDKYYVGTFGDHITDVSDNSTLHFYAQRKIDIIGSEGPKSKIIHTSYIDFVPPATPTFTSISVDAFYIDMAWTQNAEQDFSH